MRPIASDDPRAPDSRCALCGDRYHSEDSPYDDYICADCHAERFGDAEYDIGDEVVVLSAAGMAHVTPYPARVIRVNDKSRLNPGGYSYRIREENPAVYDANPDTYGTNTTVVLAHQLVPADEYPAPVRVRRMRWLNRHRKGRETYPTTMP